MLSAVLHVVAGVLVVVFPHAGTLTLTLVLAGFFTIGGVLRIVRALQHRGMMRWGFLLFDGIVTLALGGEVLAEEAAAPTPLPSPTSAPPTDASRPAPSGALPTDAPKMQAFVEAVLDDLAAQKGVADRRYDSTLRTYERALRRFAGYVGENATEGADLRALIDGYVDALRAGRWPAPKSEPPIAQVVMNHVRAFLDRSV